MYGVSGYTFETYIVFFLAFLFVAINSSVNTIIYGIFCKKYRIMLFKYFCHKSNDEDENDKCVKSVSDKKMITVTMSEIQNT